MSTPVSDLSPAQLWRDLAIRRDRIYRGLHQGTKHQWSNEWEAARYG